MHSVEDSIVECPPLLGALPLSPVTVTVLEFVVVVVVAVRVEVSVMVLFI